jgi:hypothetical protein
VGESIAVASSSWDHKEAE